MFVAMHGTHTHSVDISASGVVLCWFFFTMLVLRFGVMVYDEWSVLTLGTKDTYPISIKLCVTPFLLASSFFVVHCFSVFTIAHFASFYLNSGCTRATCFQVNLINFPRFFSFIFIIWNCLSFYSLCILYMYILKHWSSQLATASVFTFSF